MRRLLFIWNIGFYLAVRTVKGYLALAMTRSSIEVSIKIFLLALIVVFVWTVTRVVAMIV